MLFVSHFIVLRSFDEFLSNSTETHFHKSEIYFDFNAELGNKMCITFHLFSGVIYWFTFLKTKTKKH